MNPHLKEAILRQKIRSQIKKELRESKRKINEQSLYTAFVQPFTDVLQAVNLGAQDVLNSYVLHLRTFITWDPKKGQELIDAHDERKAKIAEKWKPLMERTDNALATGDADIIALAFAPGVYAVSALGSSVAEYSGDIGNYLDSSGLGGFIGGLIPGIEKKSASDSEGEGEGLLDKLEKLFFLVAVGGAAADAYQQSKNESIKKKILIKENSKADFLDDFSNYLDLTGVDDQLSSDGKELFDLLKETVTKFDSQLSERKALIDGIEAAASLEEFVAAFENAKKEANPEAEADTPDPTKIKKDLDDAVSKLVKDKAFLETSREQAGNKELSEDEIKKAAEKVVFLDAKKEFQENSAEGTQSIEEIKSSMGEKIKEILPSDAGLKILKAGKSSESKEVVDFIEKTKQSYSI